MEMTYKIDNFYLDEQWRIVDGFCRYEISNQGRLRSSYVTNKAGSQLGWRILKGGLDKDGYRKAVLCGINGVRETRRFARMVADAWMGPQPSGTVLCHDDGNRTNNAASNLVYKTQRENIADKKRHGTHQEGEKHGCAKLNAEQVRYVRMNPKTRRIEIAKELGVTTHTIDAIRGGKKWKHIL